MDQQKDRRSLYKYYGPKRGLEMLETGIRWWALPSSFNDPFDSGADNFLGDEAYPNIEYIAKSILRKHFDRLIQKTVENISPQTYEEFLNTFVEEHYKKIDFKPFTMKDSLLVLCLSETHDNNLMWSHYAQNHTGLVVNFKDPGGVDSVLKMALKVNYSNTSERPSPKIGEGYFSITKSNEWGYEKEWRIITSFSLEGYIVKELVKSRLTDPQSREESLRLLNAENRKDADKIVSDFKRKDNLPPREINAIYIGCAATDETKRKVLEIAEVKYPWAYVYQAKKHETHFQLEFEQIKAPSMQENTQMLPS